MSPACLVALQVLFATVQLTAAGADHSVLNVKQSMYLSSGPDLLTAEEVSSRSPLLSTWTFKAAPGRPDWVVIINKGLQKYLDAGSGPVTLWRKGFLEHVGDRPANIFWKLVPVPGKQDVYYIINEGRQMYLDGGQGGGNVTLWRDWRERLEHVGWNPEGLMWLLSRPFSLDLPPLEVWEFEKSIVSVANHALLSWVPDLRTEPVSETGSGSWLTTWIFKPVPNSTTTFFIINKALQSYLDAGSGPVTLWRGASLDDVGDRPENLAWKLIPVSGEEVTYYIINVGRKMYLDSAQGDGNVTLWRDWRRPLSDVGWQPRGLMWRLIALF